MVYWDKIPKAWKQFTVNNSIESVHLYKVLQPILLFNSKTLPSLLNQTLYPNLPKPQALIMNSLISISVLLPILDVKFNWNQTGFLCPASFTWWILRIDLGRWI